MLGLLALMESSTFLEDFRTGVMVGIGVVVFILYPAVLHQHEKRISALEKSGDRHEQPNVG